MKVSRSKKYILVLAVVALFLVAARVTLADDTSNGCGAIKFVPAVGIPGSPFVAGQSTDVDCTSIGLYLKSLYTYAIYVAAVAAAIVMMVGGFMWLTAGGNANQVSTARGYMAGALSGFILLLLSWTLLQTINPSLTKFKPLNIVPINNVAVESCPPGMICFKHGNEIQPVAGKGNCGFYTASDLADGQQAAAQFGMTLNPDANDADCGAPEVPKPDGGQCYCWEAQVGVSVCCANVVGSSCAAAPQCVRTGTEETQVANQEPCGGHPYVPKKTGETCQQTFIDLSQNNGPGIDGMMDCSVICPGS